MKICQLFSPQKGKEASAAELLCLTSLEREESPASCPTRWGTIIRSFSSRISGAKRKKTDWYWVMLPVLHSTEPFCMSIISTCCLQCLCPPSVTPTPASGYQPVLCFTPAPSLQHQPLLGGWTFNLITELTVKLPMAALLKQALIF